jgi:hypothetical protein
VLAAANEDPSLLGRRCPRWHAIIGGLLTWQARPAPSASRAGGPCHGAARRESIIFAGKAGACVQPTMRPPCKRAGRAASASLGHSQMAGWQRRQGSATPKSSRLKVLPRWRGDVTARGGAGTQVESESLQCVSARPHVRSTGRHPPAMPPGPSAGPGGLCRGGGAQRRVLIPTSGRLCISTTPMSQTLVLGARMYHGLGQGVWRLLGWGGNPPGRRPLGEAAGQLLEGAVQAWGAGHGHG